MDKIHSYLLDWAIKKFRYDNWKKLIEYKFLNIYFVNPFSK